MGTILVTGVNGFVGKHLSRELHSQNNKVIGIGRESKLHPSLVDIVDNYIACDLTDEAAVSRLPLEEVNVIINLAGLAQVGASFLDPEKYKEINVSVLSNIGNELLKRGLKPRIIAISTGAVYESKQPLPLTEGSLLVEGGSPYAMSKILMEQAAEELRTKGVDCIIARPFNHIGPGQGPGFLVPDLGQKIIESKQTGKPVKVGNLATRRDYTDVRDVVRAYLALAVSEKLHHNTYNICSGKSISGEKVLKTLLRAIGGTGELKIERDSTLFRPNDPLDLFGSNMRLQQDTGWKPEIPFGQTIADFVVAQES